MQEVFTASVQYDDWTGKAAADNADCGSIRDLLLERELMNQDHVLVGVKIWIGEQHAGKMGQVRVDAYLVKAKDAEEVKEVLKADKPKVEKVEVNNLSIEQFVLLFKRFSVALSKTDFGLMDRDIVTG